MGRKSDDEDQNMENAQANKSNVQNDNPSSDSEEEIKTDPASQTKYTIGENVDCLDEMNKWLNAEIISRDGAKVKVHYSAYNKKYDDWIEDTSPRLQKQWQRGDKFRLHNRIDVKDTYNKWIEAIIIAINEDVITVKYKGFTAKWNEELKIDVDTTEDGTLTYHNARIDEIGYHSEVYGVGRKRRNQEIRQNRVNQGSDDDDDADTIKLARQREDNFETLLKEEKNWSIKVVAGDGNCVFRAISHQVYGTEDHHKLVRQKCMDYIEYDKNYYKDFVSMPNIEDYIALKRQDGKWGDNLEIQVLSEIY